MGQKLTYKQYSKEYKEEAVALVREQGYSVLEAAKSLGLARIDQADSLRFFQFCAALLTILSKYISSVGESLNNKPDIVGLD